MKPNLKHYLLFALGFIHLQIIAGDTLFQSLSPSHTNIFFENKILEKNGLNILRYFDYYNGGGVAVGDINNDGLQDIYLTSNNTSANKLYLNKGNFKFEDITAKAGVAGTNDWSTGVTMADVNGDGLLDIYISCVSDIYGLNGHNQLFINNGDNTFTDKSLEYGLNIVGAISQSVFFDFDNDGDLDCFILSQSLMPIVPVKNISIRNINDSYFKSRLLRNDFQNGKINFKDVSKEAGIYQSSVGFGLGICVGDINNDGWNDIYITNDFYENDYYYLNNRNGTFTESGNRYFNHFSMYSMGTDIADYNNDGHLDIFTTDMLTNDEKMLKRYFVEDELALYNHKYINNGYAHQFSKNCLHTNNGNGLSFTENSLLSGVSATGWSWAPLFADFNNDGNKDMLITSGIPKHIFDVDFIKYATSIMQTQADKKSFDIDIEAINQIPDGSSHPYLYQGDGKLIFKDVSNEWGTKKLTGCSSGAAYSDLNNDGRLDLIINCINAPALILKNNAPPKNYIALSFKENNKNTLGIGTKAYVYTKGLIQYQQLMLTRGFQSSVEPRLNFGLDNNTTIDSILIVWPNQSYEVIKNIAVNKHLTIKKRSKKNTFHHNEYFRLNENKFADITDSISIKWKHEENYFLDYYSQPLLPHSISKRGPKLSVGDINGDGADDFYVGGASGQAGVLFIQTNTGEFIKSNSSVFEKDLHCEDVDAIFFDADNDSDLDLYVVSGGNQFSEKDPNLIDRLYLNDSKGNFTKSTNSIPSIYKDKSCISIADVDKDGDFDIFIGGLADTKNYGAPQSSYLLINNGAGKFNIQQSKAFDSIGMVTGAQFSDINNDGYADLIVVGEWMPITLFINEKGVFNKNTIPNSTGLWQSCYIDDINNDGYMDILAGNWGANNKFWSLKTPPLRLYTGNFDNNQFPYQLLSYVIDSIEYPYWSKEQIERILPAIKKKYLYSRDFAGIPFKVGLADFIKNTVPLTAEKLESVVCYGHDNSKFEMYNLPLNMQFSPISVFQKNNTTNEYFAGGNYFDLSPYEGRYDDQALILFTSNKNEIKRILQSEFDSINGQTKDLKWINSVKFGKILVVVKNNDFFTFYKPLTK